MMILPLGNFCSVSTLSRAREEAKESEEPSMSNGTISILRFTWESGTAAPEVFVSDEEEGNGGDNTPWIITGCLLFVVATISILIIIRSRGYLRIRFNPCLLLTGRRPWPFGNQTRTTTGTVDIEVGYFNQDGASSDTQAGGSNRFKPPVTQVQLNQLQEALSTLDPCYRAPVGDKEKRDETTSSPGRNADYKLSQTGFSTPTDYLPCNGETASAKTGSASEQPDKDPEVDDSPMQLSEGADPLVNPPGSFLEKVRSFLGFGSLLDEMDDSICAAAGHVSVIKSLSQESGSNTSIIDTVEDVVETPDSGESVKVTGVDEDGSTVDIENENTVGQDPEAVDASAETVDASAESVDAGAETVDASAESVDAGAETVDASAESVDSSHNSSATSPASFHSRLSSAINVTSTISDDLDALVGDPIRRPVPSTFDPSKLSHLNQLKHGTGMFIEFPQVRRDEILQNLMESLPSRIRR